MSFNIIKDILDKYLAENHPDIDFYNDIDLENCIRVFGKNYKTFISYKNLYTRSMENNQLYLRAYDFNWKNETDKNNRIFKCKLDGCSREYTSAFGLKYHMKEGHSEEKMNVYKPYICTYKGCERKYKNNNGLKYHLNKYHNIDQI